MQTSTKFLFALLAGCTAEANTSQTEPAIGHQQTVELEQAKLIVEQNATDQDTGFQGFVDGEPWQQLQVRNPDGTLVLQVNPKDNLKDLGLTELFFETNEPPNAEVPIEDVLALLPEGDYEFLAKQVDGLIARGVATLSHAIPPGPTILTPPPGATVDAATDLVFHWAPGAPSCNEEHLVITHYELIVELADQPEHPGFGSETYDVHVPATVTTLRVPHEFLRPDTDYICEVLAIAANGNQTITECSFSTN
jgi:hypothetical protein